MRTHLRCCIKLPTGASLGSTTRVHLTVEDVSLSDAPAPTVLHRAFALSDPTSGPYETDLTFPSPRAHYTIRVHIDVSGDGRITPGDYVSTARHTLTPGRPTTELQVPVTRVPQHLTPNDARGAPRQP
ncbi:hypothetical protein [Streptomyces sp. SID12501]|uniref:Uncharacterized protein n=1 Tax=Streptomyces sp. SID12501 TaxID=2706042 RepID=A0A6B3C152_9ACTN|nr:hypothetical protein [Streptomyces sp. SID12501]NEC90443.1 hypothetical protein [Streptomyces sp. SID12501]